MASEYVTIRLTRKEATAVHAAVSGALQHEDPDTAPIVAAPDFSTTVRAAGKIAQSLLGDET